MITNLEREIEKVRREMQEREKGLRRHPTDPSDDYDYSDMEG